MNFLFVLRVNQCSGILANSTHLIYRRTWMKSRFHLGDIFLTHILYVNRKVKSECKNVNDIEGVLTFYKRNLVYMHILISLSSPLSSFYSFCEPQTSVMLQISLLKFVGYFLRQFILLPLNCYTYSYYYSFSCNLLFPT